jgi:hypothetical protein
MRKWRHDTHLGVLIRRKLRAVSHWNHVAAIARNVTSCRSQKFVMTQAPSRHKNADSRSNCVVLLCTTFGKTTVHDARRPTWQRDFKNNSVHKRFGQLFFGNRTLESSSKLCLHDLVFKHSLSLYLAAKEMPLDSKEMPTLGLIPYARFNVQRTLNWHLQRRFQYGIWVQSWEILVRTECSDIRAFHCLQKPQDVYEKYDVCVSFLGTASVPKIFGPDKCSASFAGHVSGLPAKCSLLSCFTRTLQQVHEFW